MLVMSRKKDEGVVINDSILVTVVEIRGDKVRLGFEMPREVPIHRKEVHDAILSSHWTDPPTISAPSADEKRQQVVQELRRTIDSLSQIVQNLTSQIRNLETKIDQLQ
jgi:carbon storage regulator